MIKLFSNTSQCFLFLTFIFILICFIQFLLIVQLFSDSSPTEKSILLPPFYTSNTIFNCTQKLKCPNNITHFSIYIDKNIQYPNVSYIRSPIFATILDIIRNSSYYTNDSKLACVHIAPVDTLDRDRRSKKGYFTYFIEQRLKFFHQWSDPNKIHLIFNHYTGTWPSYRPTLDFILPSKYILASTSFTYTNYNCLSHITFPLFHSDYPSNITNRFFSSRKILLSFKGKSYKDVQHHRTFFHHLNNNHDIIIKYTDDKYNNSYDETEYINLLRQSYFCLVPSGRRLYSYRFLESLQYGCIPVITTNNNELIILPFSEIINWTKSIIIYSNASLSLLPYYLKNININQRNQMQNQCRNIWRKYFSSISRINNNKIMTDIIIDDDIIETNKPTTSGSSSSVTTTTTTRRPMFIETEVRTDSITKRRAGSTATSRSVYDILKDTKSPTDGLPPTTYTYAHSVSYMPVTENGSFDVPVMARRDLHGDYRAYGSSTFSSTNSVFSSPTRFISNVRSQLANGYSAIRDRLTHHSTQEHQQQQQQQQTGTETLLNSPTSHRATGLSRTSSQSSTNGETKGYNLRRRPPVHSTPRDNENEQIQQRKATSKQRKERKSQDDQEEEYNEDYNEEKETKDEIIDEHKENTLISFAKNLLYLPIAIFKFLWHFLGSLPWWLLIPLLLFLGLYTVPYLACKSLEHYPESKAYQHCRDFQQYKNKQLENSFNKIRENTYIRGSHYLKQFYHFLIGIKDWIVNFLDDVYYAIKKIFRRQVSNVKGHVNNAVETTKENAKEYCDASLQKVNNLIEEFKREKDKYLGSRHALKPAQEKELEGLIRQLVDEYAADETGQADYALEANGGKIVDTRCTEYTDEPRQNVVKFLGIPIVHMSKQPDIMIKAGRMPGQCFPFKGDQGSVIIKLAVPVKPTEFVLEHLSKSISIVGHINSAPNNFTVYVSKNFKYYLMKLERCRCYK
ncbi:unnamed protein product [Rotaria sp. Silwood2]|nr:unnamed protein product [Rotaria sp. Silwood2]